MTDAPPKGFRTFVIVWATQSLSITGSGMTGFALNIYLAQVLFADASQKAELALALMLLNLGFVIPWVVGAPLAGAFADRHDRRLTMLAADAASAALSLVTVVLMLSAAVQLWMPFVIGVLMAIASAFHFSAYDASCAMLVPDRLLPRANGMIQTVWSFSEILSPALAATIMAIPMLLPSPLLAGAAGGTALVMVIDAMTFLISALVLAVVHVPSPRRADLDHSGRIEASIWADVRSGARYIVQRPALLWLLGTFTAANLAGAPFPVLTPLLVKFNLAPDWTAHGLTFEAALALLVTASGIGGLLGGLCISLWGGLKRRRVYGVLLPMLGAGLAQIVYGLSPVIAVSAVAAAVGAAMHPLLNAHSQAIWQTRTPREMQGRVFAVRRVIAQSSLPLGSAIAGALGGVVDPGLVLAGLGLALAIVCATQLANPVILKVDEP
jgi:MFS family permease